MRNCRTIILLLLLLPWLPATAEPVPEEQRVGIDLRRTTLVVRDIDASLKLYRDALGMQVIYDNRILTPRDAGSVEAADRALRLVFLRANDNYVGILGLLQYIKPHKHATSQGMEPFSVGSSVLLFNTSDLDSRFEKARNTVGVRVVSEPELVEYPAYDGNDVIRVRVSTITDPDGFIIELNQLLGGLR